jgi:hypothetical protein
MNISGDVMIPPKYEMAFPFREGLAVVMTSEGSVQMIRPDGSVALPLKGYAWAASFSGGRAAVTVKKFFGKIERQGYIDHTGDLVIPCQYKKAGSFSEGKAVVYTDENRGLVIDPQGNKLFSFINVQIFDAFCEGRLLYLEKGLWGFMDARGEKIIPAQYERAYAFREGLAAVKKQGQWQYIDPSGAEAFSLPLGIKYVTSFSEGKAVVTNENGQNGYINQKGQEVIGLRFKNAGSFYDGLAPVTLEDGMSGYIDEKGDWVIEPKYLGSQEFENGLGRVFFRDSQGTLMSQYINREGVLIGSPCVIDVESANLQGHPN